MAVINGMARRGLPRTGRRTPLPEPRRRESLPRLEIWDDHLLVGGGEVPLDERQVREALRRGSVLISGARARVFEVYCARCRKAYEDATGTPCIVEPELLHGGPIATRNRRKKGDEEDPATGLRPSELPILEAPS